MTVFEMIIDGEIPGRFVYADPDCVAFATIEPVAPGHILLVPRLPYPAWTDLPAPLAAHLMKVAQRLAKAQLKAFACQRIGLTIAGFEVPHTHLHLIPLKSEADLSLANAKVADDEQLDFQMHELRQALYEAGEGVNVPEDLHRLA